MSEQTLMPGKISPHSREAEEAVIGSILINPDAYLDVSEFLAPEDFFILRNSWVWAAMQRLDRRRETIEYLAVIEELRTHGQLEDIGGAAYITYLASNIGTSVYVETYGRIVQRASVRRRMLVAAGEIDKIARDEEMDINDVIEHAEQKLLAATALDVDSTDLSIQDVVSLHYDHVEKLYLKESSTIGVPSGLPDLDSILMGFQKEDLIYLAGRPGMGKTATMLNILRKATAAGARCGVISLEMSSIALMNRLMAMETGINATRIWRGDLTEAEFEMYVEATSRFGNLSARIDDRSGQTLSYVRKRARYWRNNLGLDMLFIDYDGLMHSDRGANTSTVEEAGDISDGLKGLARELHIPIMVASQLNRDLEKRKNKIPILSDLRESGNKEQNADVVIFLYRDDLYHENSERPNEIDMVVAKHRNGPTGTATFYFRKHLQEIVPLTRTTVSLKDF